MSAFQWRNPGRRSEPDKKEEGETSPGTDLAYAEMAARQNSGVTRRGHADNASEGEDEARR